MATQARITTLLSNEALSRASHLRLGATRRFTNKSRGEHLTGKGGSSTDFSDYRNYAEGDDVRFVDWNIFSRLNKPYLKLFHQEEEMHVVIVIDASSSMDFENKFKLAQQLAAGFSVIGLFNNEKVSVWAFNEYGSTLATSGPANGRPGVRKLFRFIETVEPGGSQPLDLGIDALIKQQRGRGVMILLSDFLTFGDLRKTFNAIHSHGLELFAMQILGPSELDPELNGDVRMVDVETDATLDVTAAGDLIAMYQDYLARHQRTIELLAQQRGGKFVTVSAGADFNKVMFDELRRKGWVR